MRGHPATPPQRRGIKVRLWRKFGQLKVWLVAGDVVRKHLYKDFISGGHDRIYRFIPRNEIWIEDSLNVNDRWLTLLHELHERKLMGQGKGYYQAHRSATMVEAGCKGSLRKCYYKVTEILNK